MVEKLKIRYDKKEYRDSGAKRRRNRHCFSRNSLDKDLLKESENPREYERNDNPHYSEKKNHRERTLGNETNRKRGHKIHWKKIK